MAGSDVRNYYLKDQLLSDMGKPCLDFFDDVILSGIHPSPNNDLQFFLEIRNRLRGSVAW